MTTQVRPIGGGGWNTVQMSTANVPAKAQTYGVTLTAGYSSLALSAIGAWVDCGGVGAAANLAQSMAAGLGLQLQEV
jgi:hypothetical protein